MDSLRTDTGACQLIAIGCLQIDTCMAVAGRREEVPALREAFFELIDHFAANFVAAGIRCRSDCGAQIFGPGSVFASQLPDCAYDDRLRSATPAGMHCGAGPGFGIGNQHGNAVGSLYCQQNPGSVADQGVTAFVIAEHVWCLLRFLVIMNDAYVGTVNLPAAGQDPVPCEEFEKTATILVNVFSVVFVKSGQVERLVGQGTNAAQPRGKSISETILFQRRAHQGAHAIAFVPVEPGFLECGDLSPL